MLQLGQDTTAVLDDVFDEIYGVAYSSMDDDGESLEWRYLHWLQGAKTK